MMERPCLKQTNNGLISMQGVVIHNESLRRYSDYDSTQKWLQKMPQHVTNSSHCWHAMMLLHQTHKVENYEPLFITSATVKPLASISVALIQVESSVGRFFHLTKYSK